MCLLLYTAIITTTTITTTTIILLEARNLLFFKGRNYWDTCIFFQKDFRSSLKSKSDLGRTLSTKYCSRRKWAQHAYQFSPKSRTSNPLTSPFFFMKGTHSRNALGDCVTQAMFAPVGASHKASHNHIKS